LRKADQRIAYLSGRYPALSHTFVMREVEALRRLGEDIETLSIHRARSEDLLTDADRDACRTTFAVLPISPTSLVRAHLEALRARPIRYLKTLALALRMSPPGLRGTLWGVFYFAEAMVIWQHCRRTGVRHVHAQFADTATESALLVSHFESGRGGGRRAWSWSLAVHGPVEFYDVSVNRLGEKLRRASFALSISDFGRSQLMALVDEEHWDKLHVVHCGLDPAVFEHTGEDTRAGDESRIICVGRLVHHKGHAILLEAIAELARKGVPVRAVIVGDGPKRASLERLTKRLAIADRVVFTGGVGQDRIRDLYAEADICCLPSFAEGIPVVLMEAMAIGLPVVTTRIMGIPELVEDGVSGLLVPPGRPTELAHAIERLIDDPAARRRMGSAGRERVVADFDVNRSAEKLSGIFRRELGRV
jgi:glycosyltransferase involved in cell wall biosynthesis